MIDNDLRFLEKSDSSDLKILCDYFKTKRSERLSRFKAYKQNYPNNLSNIADKIANELQLFGGNTIVNFFRRKGVSYYELLSDVCDKHGVNTSNTDKAEEKEEKLIRKLLIEEFGKKSEEEKNRFCHDHNLNIKYSSNEELCDEFIKYLEAYEYVSSFYIRRTLGSEAVKETFGPHTSLADISYIELIIKLAGPAFDVTLPCVVHIAYMRRKNILIKKAPKIVKKCAITLLGISQAGKTLFRYTLASLNKPNELSIYKNERTLGVSVIKPFDFLLDDETLIKIEKGSDIGGNLENQENYKEYVNQDRVVFFFFDIERYLNNDKYYELTNKQLDIFYNIQCEAEIEMNNLHVIATHEDILSDTSTDGAKERLKNRLHQYNWDYFDKVMKNLYLVNMTDPSNVKERVINPIFSKL